MEKLKSLGQVRADHPDDSSLERFLLHQASEQEIVAIETHVLCCDLCLSTLETLEVFVAATRAALQSLHAESVSSDRTQVARRASRWNWLTVPRLSLVGAALALIVLSTSFAKVPREIRLTATRGSESTVTSSWVPLRLTLNAEDLPPKPTWVELMTTEGQLIWHGPAPVEKDAISVNVGRITQSGHYLIKVFPSASRGQELREYTFSVQ